MKLGAPGGREAASQGAGIGTAGSEAPATLDCRWRPQYQGQLGHEGTLERDRQGLLTQQTWGSGREVSQG